VLVTRQEDDLHARIEVCQDLDRLPRSLDIKIDQHIVDHDRQWLLLFTIMLNERQANCQIELLARSGAQLPRLFSLACLVHHQQRTLFVEFSFDGYIAS